LQLIPRTEQIKFLTSTFVRRSISFQMISKIKQLPKLKFLKITGIDMNWAPDTGMTARDGADETRLQELQLQLPETIVLNEVLYKEEQPEEMPR